MANKKLKAEAFRTIVLPLFESDFSAEEESRYTVHNEFSCAHEIDSPISPNRFKIMTDKVSLKKILRMSWKNTSGVSLKNIRMNIVASNSTTEWRITDAEFDVSDNTLGLTERYGVIIPDGAERCTIEITYVGLADGLFWDKSGEFFSFDVGAKTGIFLTDAQGNRIFETKTKPKTQKKKKSNVMPLVFVAITALVIGIAVFAASGMNLMGDQKEPMATTGTSDIWGTTAPNTTMPTYTTATTSPKVTVSTTGTKATTSTTATTEKPHVPANGLYVDVDFENGKVTDSEGNSYFKNIGTPVVETVTVTHNGVTKEVEALHITQQGNFVYGTFNKLDTAEEMNAVLNRGFSVEAFYLDNSTGTAAIMCMTENAGGWGLAHYASKGAPYFITGNGSSSYNAAYAPAVSDTELVHVVGVYDPEAKMHTIYVNGVECSDRSTWYPGTDVSGVSVIDETILSQDGVALFNTFGLGGEFANAKYNKYDFMASDMVIVDAKFYVGALTAEEALAAYEAATKDFVAVEEPHIPEKGIYVDVDFDYENEEITDSKGNAYFTNIGTPLVDTVTVTHNGVTREMNALCIIQPGNFVYGTFNKLDTAEKMNEMLSQGFSVEAFYLDNSASSAAIFCMTETPSGWGLAHNASKGAPYFITGNGSSSGICWNAAYSSVKVSDAELVHVVGVYDPEAKMHTIYVNGVECSDRTWYPGTDVPGVSVIDETVLSKEGVALFNTFGLGGEFASAKYNRYDFMASDMVIVDAKFYVGALTAEEVAEAYLVATKDFVEDVTPKYTDELFAESGYELEYYDKLELSPVAKCFYNSTSGSALNLSMEYGDTASKFCATNIFTKEQIPVGSVIVIMDEYRYRPEGWVDLTIENTEEERPAETSDIIVVVDEAWWGNFNYRAFNFSEDIVSVEDRSVMTEEDFGAIAIYVPKQAEEPEEPIIPEEPEEPEIPVVPEDPAVPEENGVYVDVDFENGKVTDSKGNAYFTNIGTPVVGTVTVTHNGVTKEMEALRITQVGNFVYGTFNNLDTEDKMNEMLAQGFSIEAFYLDNSTASGAVFCMTQASRGFGIVHQKNNNSSQNNKPYFVTGNGSAWNMVYASAAVSDTELVHVVGVYNPETQEHSIYVNGSICGTTSNIPGVVATNTISKDGIAMFNTFGIGGEFSPMNAYDFGATDMTVVDLKFYNSALTAEDVLAAYEAATAEFCNTVVVFVPAANTSAAINLATGNVYENISAADTLNVKGGYLYLMAEANGEYRLMEELGAAVETKLVTGGATNCNDEGNIMLKSNSYLIKSTSLRNFSLNSYMDEAAMNALLSDEFKEAVGYFGTITITNVQSDDITFILDGDIYKQGYASDSLYNFNDEDYKAFKFVYVNYDGSGISTATGTYWNPIAMHQMELIRYATDKAWGMEYGWSRDIWQEAMRTYGGYWSIETVDGKWDGQTVLNKNVKTWSDSLIPVQYTAALTNYKAAISEKTEAQIKAEFDAAKAALDAAQKAFDDSVAANADVAALKAEMESALEAYNAARQAEYDARVIMEAEKAKDSSSAETVEATNAWKEVAKAIFDEEEVNNGNRSGTGPIAQAYLNAKAYFDMAIEADDALKALSNDLIANMNDGVTTTADVYQEAQTAQKRVETYYEWLDIYEVFEAEYEKAANVMLWSPLENDDDDFMDSALYQAFKDIENENRAYPTYTYYYDVATKTYTIFVTSGTQENMPEKFENTPVTGLNYLVVPSDF